MQLNIKEARENNITKVESSINIDLSLLSSLINSSKEELIIDMIKSNQIINSFNPPVRIMNLIINCALGKENTDVLKETLIDNGIPILSLILSVAIGYNQKYNYLKEIEKVKEVFIFCNENNFTDALNISKRFNAKVIISAQKISLISYKKLIEDFGVENINEFNVYIDYQKNNSPILISTVYKISCIINAVVEEINSYDLSPLEKIMFVYDRVKYRLYEDNLDDINSSRDLDKVLNGDKIVCAGYSNLFTAVLTSLGINSIPVIDLNIKHQRSLAYIKDAKYNIDGVYAFDPTWDKRKNKDDINYIDRYDYFLMPLVRSMNSCYCEISELLELDKETILKIIDGKDMDSALKVLDRLNILFTLVDAKYIPDDKYYVVEEIAKQYDQVIGKYYSSEISFEDFINLLYSVRVVESTSGMINNINKDNIRETSIKRYMNVNKKKEKIKIKD